MLRVLGFSDFLFCLRCSSRKVSFVSENFTGEIKEFYTSKSWRFITISRTRVVSR